MDMVTNMDRLEKQIQFITLIDEAKQVFRQNVVIRDRRPENDAEHSWHLAVMALILSEYSTVKDLDVAKVIKMILIHDLIEIYAGDTFCYDEVGIKDKAERERLAADKLFSQLPKDQAEEFKNLWLEFETEKSSEAAFAACLDHLQPLILNYNTEGHTWKYPGVTKEKVLQRNVTLQKHAPLLWDYAKMIIDNSVAKGYLRRV